jgi:hypothetical protein
MPTGIETFVDNGFATVDFVDPSLRGQALTKLSEIGGPESIETITRDGPRRKYRVPEGNAREAGLIDTPLDAPRRGDLKFAAALADADPVADGGIYSPELHTVKGANDAGPVAQSQVVSNQSITTTESEAPADVAAVAPPHVEVQAKVRNARPKVAKKAPAKRAGKSGAPTIAAQKAALASDPQSRPEVTAGAPDAAVSTQPLK